MGNTTASNLSTGFVNAAFTQVYTGNYSSVSGTNTFQFSAPFVWDGSSNVLVNFCFDNGSSAEALADVVDGTTAPLGTGIRAATYSSSTTGSGCALAAGLISDGRITATFAASSGNPIATLVNVTKSEFIANAGLYQFYNANEIISNISNASAGLGCVTARIFESGTNWQSFYAGPRSQKVVDVAVSTNSNATYNVGLYYTAAELGGKTPGTLNIAGTTATSMAAADITNSNVYATTFVPFGTGYLYTATVTGNGRFFLTEGNVTSLFQLNRRRENFVQLLQNPVSNNIALNINNQVRKDVSAKLFNNSGQLVKTWNLGKADGIVLLPFSGTWVANGTYIIRIDAGIKTQSLKLVKQ
jgi:hypothetical protein